MRRGGDDEGDGGYMYHRAPGPAHDDRAAHDSGGRPRVPGKRARGQEPRPVYTAAFGAAMAERHTRTAEDSAGRIEALAAELNAAIASANYAESARLAFELRMAERRGRTALSDYTPGRFGDAADRATSAARERLEAAVRNAMLLICRAPELETPDAASEDAELAWRSTLGRTAEPVAGTAPAQTWAGDTADLASRLGLGSVDVRADDTARSLTDSHGARGVALGGVVHLHPDRVQPGTSAGREVLAHELVHLAQARLSPEHDHGRDAAEHEAAEIARSLASGGAGRAPVRHIDLACPAADRHAEGIQVPAGTVDARGYINPTGNAVRINEAIVAEVNALMLPDPPAARLSWKDSGPFRARLQRALAVALGRAAKAGDLATRLVELTYPDPVLDVLDANRDRNKSQPIEGRVLGPDRWQDAAGRAIADTVATAVAESIVRLGSRYVAAADDAARRRAEDGWESAYVLIRSHPMDEHVADALLGDDQGKSTLVVAPAPAAKAHHGKAHGAHAKEHTGKPTVERGWRVAKVTWMGATDPTLWNWVRADPADATAEEVSAAIYDGDTTHAAWLTAAPPYFALHPDRARKIQDAVAHRPADAQAVASDAADDRSIKALTATTVGDKAALSQGSDVQLADKSGAGALAEAEAALTDTGKQLAYLTEVLTPWGVVAELYPAMNFDLRCRAGLAAAGGAEATAWEKVAVGQQQNLFEIAGAVAAIVQGLKPETAGPVHDLLAEYARAAGSAHLASTGHALLEKARKHQARFAGDAALASAEATRARVEQARSATEQSNAAAVQRGEDQAKAIASAPEMWRSAIAAVLAEENKGDVSRSDMRRERDDLTHGSEALDGQVRQIRADAIAGNGTDTDAVDEAMLRSAELEFRARARAVRLGCREIERTAHDVDKGLISKVVTAIDGQISGVEAFCALVRVDVDSAVAMLDITHATADKDLSAAEERQARRDALAKGEARLAEIGGMPVISAFMNAAWRIIQKHQFRAALANLAAMIGVGFVASAAGGLIAKAAVGETAATGVLGTTINLGTEAFVNTVAGGALSGHDVTFRDFVENAIASAAARLIMHPFAKGAAGAVEGFEKAIWQVRGARLALKTGIEVGAEAVVQVAINYTAAMAARSGEVPTQKSVDDWMIEGLGIALGRFMHGQMERMQGRIKQLPHEVREQLQTDAAALAKAARELDSAPNEATARELLDRAQALAEREQALMAAHAASATGVAKTKALASAREAANDAAASEAEAASAAFGALHEVAPGAVYEGPPNTILTVVEKAGKLGIEVVGHDEVTGRWTLKREGKVFHVDEVRAADHQQRVVLAGNDARVAARAALVPSEAGRLDVFLHGKIDDFIIKTSGGDVHISHRSLATAIRKSGLDYERVRLISCNSGKHAKGVAQHLANKLGVPVEAPTDGVYIHEDGSLTIGPHEDRDTGRWIVYTPRQAETRSKPAAEPEPSTPRERLDKQRSARAHGMGETIDADSAASEAARRHVAETISAIPVAHVKAGTVLAGARDAVRHDTYFVSHSDGERMVAALETLPDAGTRRFKNGFIVRYGKQEWFFEFRNEGVTTAAVAAGADTGAIGLPPPNAATIEIWGFRGVRKIDGRPKSEWTAEENKAVEDIKGRDPLMFAGHVGLSFDGGKTIYGFLPAKPDEVPMENFLDYLLAHNAVRGNVANDTAIFRRAEEHAADDGWSTNLKSVVELVDTAEKSAAIKTIVEMVAGKHALGYMFPYPEPVNGSYYQDSNGYRADDLANCAAFPAMIGVRIPEPSGNLHLYMPALDEWAAADGPMDFRTVQTHDETEKP